MKQIIENRYLKGFRFSSSEEALFFYSNQNAKKTLFIADTYGENHYCYVCYHSLTKEKQFVLFFSSDENEDNITFLFWNRLLVLGAGENIYLIDNEALKISSMFEVTTTLIGLYLVNKEQLLLLEEAYMRVVDRTGKIVMDEKFDLIEEFSIEEGFLQIQTSHQNKIIKLNG